jgi:hypothetical protein
MQRYGPFAEEEPPGDGGAKTGRLWTYVRDERPFFQGSALSGVSADAVGGLQAGAKPAIQLTLLVLQQRPRLLPVRG